MYIAPVRRRDRSADWRTHQRSPSLVLFFGLPLAVVCAVFVRSLVWQRTSALSLWLLPSAPHGNFCGLLQTLGCTYRAASATQLVGPAALKTVVRSYHREQDGLSAALEEFRRSIREGNGDLENQWLPLLDRIEDRVMRVEIGLEQAEDKFNSAAQNWGGWYLFELIMVTTGVLVALAFVLLSVISLSLREQQVGGWRLLPPARLAVLRALGELPTTRSRTTLATRLQKTVVDWLNGMVPMSATSNDPRKTNGRVSRELIEGMDKDGNPQASFGPLEMWDVRVRQRARNAGQIFRGMPNVVQIAKESVGPHLSALFSGRAPARAVAVSGLIDSAFSDPRERDMIKVALSAAAKALPADRWRFKEAVLHTIVDHLRADACTVVTLLLHDLDDCLGLPWSSVADALTNTGMFGDEVIALITEKKRLEQVSLLLYLRALAQPRAIEDAEHAAAMQILLIMYLKKSYDFRPAFVEISEVEHMLAEALRRVANSQLELPVEGRAFARCALDLHAPLAHGLGLRSSAGRTSPNERHSPSLEDLALRLHFPSEYRNIEEWMLQEDQLLHRTLGGCVQEVRRALQADPDFTGLAGFRISGRVKSVYSLVKKLLRQRGVSLAELKTEAVKDLLALEVVVTPDPQAEVPQNPRWLEEEWRERAACFSALDALQRYARNTAGWDVWPGSTKDYITKSKKSGYRALHITLCTNIRAVLPKASSPSLDRARTETTMPCKIEIHIFSAAMKQKERVGSASHGVYKAFALSTEELFTALAGGATAGKLQPSDLRRIVFPAEKMALKGEMFTASFVDAEFDELSKAVDANSDGRLSFGEVQKAQREVVTKLEAFQAALSQRKTRSKMDVSATAPGLSSASPSVDFAPDPLAGLDCRQKVEVLYRALEIVKEAHQGQLRKSGDPYWTHPLTVADNLARLLLPPVAGIADRIDAVAPEILEKEAASMWVRVARAPDDVFTMYVAALLHDTVEDTTMTLRQIAQDFGPTVSALVDGVTKTSSKDGSQAFRSRQDLLKVLARGCNDVRVLIIKFADRLHNMRTLEHMPPHKQRRIAEETRAVYIPLADRLGIHVWKSELSELCARYLNGYAYEALVQYNLSIALGWRRNSRYVLQYFRTLLVDLVSDRSILQVDMTEEPLHTQLRRWAAAGPNAPPPTRVPRVRLVTKDRGTCWSCLGRIHALLPPMTGRLRDYVSSPKENLYMSLHTAVLMDGSPVEVYIKSMEMDWVAEYGVAAHWRHGEELQHSSVGRSLQEALQSTWLREDYDSLERSLRSVEADMTPVLRDSDVEVADDSLSREDKDTLLDVAPLLEHVARVATTMPTAVCALAAGHGGSAGSLTASTSMVAATNSSEAGLASPQDISNGQRNGSKSSTGSAGGGPQLRFVHRACSEALREKVTVFTPTGRVLYLPRDATALDFAVWNLGTRKGLRAESAVIDGCPAPLHTRLQEGQTVLVHLRENSQDDPAPPPLAWAGLHIRYLRTTRARAALARQRSELLGAGRDTIEGRKALIGELRLQSLEEPGVFGRLGNDVLAAVGQGQLPAELVSAHLLVARLGHEFPLGDASYEYDSQEAQPETSSSSSQAEEATVDDAPAPSAILSVFLVGHDRPGFLCGVVDMINRHGLDLRGLTAEPRGRGLCIIVATMQADCALRFGSMLHGLRSRVGALLVQRVPTELVVPRADHGTPTATDGVAAFGQQHVSSACLRAWLQDSAWLEEPSAVSGDIDVDLEACKHEALKLAEEAGCRQREAVKFAEGSVNRQMADTRQPRMTV